MIYGIRLNSHDGKNPSEQRFENVGEARVAFALERDTAPAGIVGAMFCQSATGATVTLDRFAH